MYAVIEIRSSLEPPEPSLLVAENNALLELYCCLSVGRSRIRDALSFRLFVFTKKLNLLCKTTMRMVS